MKNKKSIVYADVSGSCQVKTEVKKLLDHHFKHELFGNPNSAHRIGSELASLIEASRGEIANILDIDPDSIIFNSGSTESIRHVFFSQFERCEKADSLILYSPIEHSATLENVNYYRALGIETRALTHKVNGLLDMENLQLQLSQTSKTNVLVAVMAAHNETGVIQPYKEIGDLSHAFNAKYFSDTTQLIGKERFSFDQSSIDFATVSGHKLGGLPGIGALLVRDPWSLKPLIIGGGQENNLRSGTQNYLGIYSLSAALRECLIHLEKVELDDCARRRKFETWLLSNYPGSMILGKDSPRVEGITFCAIKGINRLKLTCEFSKHGILITTGSACSDKKKAQSKTAMMLTGDEWVASNTLRISLGDGASKKSYKTIKSCIQKCANELALV